MGNLSRQTITSEHQEKVDYYAEDESIAEEQTEYYAPKKGLAKGNAKWIGALKKEFGLGEVLVRGTFKEVSQGIHPLTKEPLKEKKPNAQSKDQLFHDFCFSPNKSISIAALVLGKGELIEAHNEAVEEIALYIQEKYGGCRIQKDGVRENVLTGKMLFAALNHYTARPVKEGGRAFIDPQLHTHLLAMHTTIADDGKWRALQHDGMCKDGSLGFLYTQIMAQKVQALGFRIREVKAGFELADISDADIKVFSKRSQQAKKQLEAEGLEVNSTNINEKILKIRKGKQGDLTLEDLREQWEPQATGMSVIQHEHVDPLGHGSVEDELQFAINHLSERSVDFHRSNIQQYVFKHVQSFTREDLDEAIAKHPDLINTESERYSTVKALKQELTILDLWRSGIGSKSPLIESVPLDELRESYWVAGKKIQLNESQAIAIKNVLESDHQFQVIKGLAGVGKTTAIAEFISQLKKNGNDVELFGFAGTHEAKAELEKSLKLQSRTVASLTTSGSEGRIWVVDEAGLNSNREWVEVLTMAKNQGVRVIMLGDPGQNSSVEAGSPMASTIYKYPETAQEMSKIIRQQNPRQLKAVELISAGRGAEAIKLLDENNWLHQITDREERATVIAQSFTKLTPKEMNRTVLISGTNLEREAITKTVRHELKGQNLLGDSVKIDALYSRNFSKQEAKEARSYQAGDWVKFHNVPRGTFLKSGTLYKITAIDEEKLKIQTVEGRQYSLTPSKFKGNIEALFTKKIDIAVGDRARFSGTVRANDWYNGSQLEITAISGEWIEGKDKDGKTHRIDTLAPAPIDHDWVGTSYRRQGKTAYRAIVSLTSDRTSSKEPSTVSLSRQTHEINVFTESKDDLLKLVQRSNRQKNVLDTFGYDDSSLAALKEAISNFEKNGGKARDHIDLAIKKGGKREKASESTREKALVKKWTENYNRLLSRIQRQPIEQSLEELSNGYLQDQFGSSRSDGISIGQIRGDIDRSNREPGNTERLTDEIGHRGSYETQGRGKQDPQGSERSQDIDRRNVQTASSTVSAINNHSDLDRIADRLFTIRLGEQIAQPMAELRESFEQLSAIAKSNDLKRSEIAERLQNILLSRKDSAVEAALEDHKEAFPRTIDLPKKVEAWTPNYEGVKCPEHLTPKHFEHLKTSGIHPDLIALNYESIKGDEIFKRLNWSGPHARLAQGGWWGFSGVHAPSLLNLQSGEKPIISDNGTFKSDNPRLDAEKTERKGVDSFVKYENPLGKDRPFFLPNIPNWLAEKTYEKYSINPTEAERASGVWHIIQKYNLPITIIEGSKKCLASWSQGIPTIGAQGITYYKAFEKLEDGKERKLEKRQLLASLIPFATPGRKITIANDQDSNPETRKIVMLATIRSAEVLSENGSLVHIANWKPEQGKGGDDLIVKSGPKAYISAINNAKPWEGEATKVYRERYNKSAFLARQTLGVNTPQIDVDVAVWRDAIDKGDVFDGLRYLRQSNGFRNIGEDYIKEVGAIASRKKELEHPLELGC